MEAVLETSRYDALTGRGTAWQETIINFIIDTLDRIFGNMVIPEGSSVNARWIGILLTVVIGILITVAAFIFYKMIKESRSRKSYSDIYDEIVNKAYTAQELIELSKQSQDQRISVRYRYIAALLAMNQERIVKIEPSFTNAIIEKQIKKSKPELSEPFSQVADVFHRTWFGKKVISENEHEIYVKSSDTLIRGGIS